MSFFKSNTYDTITFFALFIPRWPKSKIISKNHKPIKNICCLVATKRGLYIISKGNVFYLLPGDFYGLTSDTNGRWYAIQRFTKSSRIISFLIQDSKIMNPQQLIKNLPPGCHQIDFVHDQLYVTDTYNNRLIIFTLNKGKLYQRNNYFPAGKLENGRHSNNYVHLNSIWKNKDGLYLIFHNETSKTGRLSEIVLLDPNQRIKTKSYTGTSNAHNVIKFNESFMICNSMNGSLELGGKIIFKTDKFTRGLSICDNYIIVGGSDYGQRGERSKLKGTVYFLDTNYKRIHSIDMPGMVQEIRTISHKDYSLSNNNL